MAVGLLKKHMPFRTRSKLLGSLCVEIRAVFFRVKIRQIPRLSASDNSE